MKRLRWALAAFVLIAALAYVYVQATEPTPAAIVEVRDGAAERVLAITGRTRPQVTVTIVPKVSGQIVKLTKEEGVTVRAGELLVQLDADAPRAAVDQVESAIAAQRRALAEAERAYERAAQLRTSGLATIKDYDAAKFDLDQARAELERLAATRREALARLGDATITAPVSGVVLTRPVDLGQVVGGQSVIYEIAPLADVEVEADVDERFLAEVREGQKADLLIAGLGRPVRATLDYISPKVDPRTGGAKVRFSLDEQVEGLRSGLTADVNLIVEQRARALTVPRASILGRDAAARVLVVGDDGRVQERPVRFIEWPSDRVIVTDGLRAGERLLAQPRPDLVGERVAALPPPEGAAMPRGSAQKRSLAAASNNLSRPL